MGEGGEMVGGKVLDVCLVQQINSAFLLDYKQKPFL